MLAMRSLRVLAINVIAAIAVLFAAEGLLALFGYPADVPYKTSHRPNTSKTYRNIEFEYDFVTNSLGLRYPELPAEKPPGSTRIIMLGDSFTEGVGVEAHETFGVYLEQALGAGGRVQFVNGGLGGEGPLRFWRVFRQVGLPLDPDGVLVCLYANDVMDTPESVTREDLYRLAPEQRGFGARLHGLVPRVHNVLVEAGRQLSRERQQSGGFVDTAASLARERGIGEERIEAWRARLPAELVEASDRGEFNRSLLSMGLVNPGYWEEAINLTTALAQRKYDSMRLILDEIADVARARGMAIGLVYIPAPLQYDPSRHADWNPWVIGGVATRPGWLREDSELQRRLAAWAQARGMPYLDLAPILRKTVAAGETLNIRLDGHWTARGHRVVGEALAAWIEAENVFPNLFAGEARP